MKRGLSALIAVAALTGLAIHARGSKRERSQSRVERGRYLVQAMACGACHSPKTMGPDGSLAVDESRLLSGHREGTKLPPPPSLPPGPWIEVGYWEGTAWAGPWGISYTMNLTPDENTGIGSWSEETFVEAIRTGRHMGVSRPILPPMPWDWFRNLSDEDLKSIYAYLRTIPPVHNRIPEPVPPVARTADDHEGGTGE